MTRIMKPNSNSKRFFATLVTLVLPVLLLGQTQYDYYDDDKIAGGVDTAINGLMILGIIVGIIATILFLTLIYGYFTGWLNKTPKYNSAKSTDGSRQYNKEAFDQQNDGVKSFDNSYELSIENASDNEIEEGIVDKYGVVYSRDYTQLLRCNNEEIEEYYVKKECKVIRSNAFSRCYHLSKVILPIELTHIGNSAFAWCNFSSLKLPSGLKYIGDWAFTDCINLSDISLPDNMEYLGDCAFVNCEKLYSLYLPPKLNHIGESAFRSTNIRSVTCDSPCFSFDNGCLVNTKTKKFIAFFSDSSEVVIPNGVIEIGRASFCKHLK